jgi:hypothetical protein
MNEYSAQAALRAQPANARITGTVRRRTEIHLAALDPAARDLRKQAQAPDPELFAISQ